MKNKFLGNKGFTLVEVLVAVAILALIAIPLVANFAMSSRVNQKSRKNLDTTTMAQNVMEGMNAYSAEDIIKQFDSYSGSGQSLKFLPTGTTVDSYGELQHGVDSKTIGYGVKAANGAKVGTLTVPQYSTGLDISGNSIAVQPNADNTYYLWVKGIAQGNQNYDMRLIMNANTYAANSSVKVANIASMNSLYDAFYQDDGTSFADACAYYDGKNNDSWITQSMIAENLKRTVTVEVVNQGTVADPDYAVRMTNKYELLPGYISLTVSDRKYSQTTETLFSSKIKGKNPRNIYIYYEPNYKSYYYSGTKLDNIEVINAAQQDVNVYLVRMADTTDASLQSKETNYGVNVYLDERNPLNPAATIVSHTGICSDLGTNLGDLSVPKSTSPSRAIYSYCNNSGMYSLMNATVYSQIVTSLADQQVKNRLYAVTLEVYESGAADNSFPAEDLITTFKGGAE